MFGVHSCVIQRTPYVHAMSLPAFWSPSTCVFVFHLKFFVGFWWNV